MEVLIFIVVVYLFIKYANSNANQKQKYKDNLKNFYHTIQDASQQANEAHHGRSYDIDELDDHIKHSHNRSNWKPHKQRHYLQKDPTVVRTRKLFGPHDIDR